MNTFTRTHTHTYTFTFTFTFTYLDKNLRTLTIDGNPWFHATDACNILGLSTDKGTFMHTSRLGEDERRLCKTPRLTGGRRAPTFTAVSESGLYKLIMRSDKAEAREFQEWVTREVLPSIRKTGGGRLSLTLQLPLTLGEGSAARDASPRSSNNFIFSWLPVRRVEPLKAAVPIPFGKGRGGCCRTPSGHRAVPIGRLPSIPAPPQANRRKNP